MTWKIIIGTIFIILSWLVGKLLVDMTGAGGFKRMVTITGVYSVCRPDKYDVVCFLDADSKQGAMSCIPLANIGGECKK